MALKKILIIGMLILKITFSLCYGQQDNNVLYLNSNFLKKYKIVEIKVFAKKSQDPITDSTFSIFYFQNGLLTKQALFSPEIYNNIREAIDNANIYTYSKGKLLVINGIDGPGAHQGPFELYKYFDNNLSFTFEGEEHWSNVESGKEIQTITKWVYWPDKRINYSVEYNFDLNGEDENFLNKMLPEFKRATDSDQPSSFLKRLNINEIERIYFIYDNHKRLIGKFPVKASGDSTTISTIHSSKKLRELKRNGFEYFKRKNLGNALVWAKVIDDSYQNIRSSEFLLDGLTLKQFLSKIGHPNMKYVIFEPVENNFLFYKLLD